MSCEGGKDAVLGLNQTHRVAHTGTPQSQPPSRLSPCLSLPSQGPAPSLLIALQCHCGERAAEGPGIPVPGLGPRPCPHPRESTRPRGPQEMAVLCHGRCLLLTPRSGTSPGTSWLVATGLVGFPGRSPCHPPAREDGDHPRGGCTHSQNEAPSPTISCVRPLASGSSC